MSSSYRAILILQRQVQILSRYWTESKLVGMNKNLATASRSYLGSTGSKKFLPPCHAKEILSNNLFTYHDHAAAQVSDL